MACLIKKIFEWLVQNLVLWLVYFNSDYSFKKEQ